MIVIIEYVDDLDNIQMNHTMVFTNEIWMTMVRDIVDLVNEVSTS